MRYRIVYTGVSVLPYTVEVKFTGDTETWILIAKEETPRQCYDAIKAHSGFNQIVIAEIET